MRGGAENVDRAKGEWEHDVASLERPKTGYILYLLLCTASPVIGGKVL